MRINIDTTRTYRGFALTRSHPGADWSVTLPEGNGWTGGPRTRWGRLGEVCNDVDAYLQGTLAPHRRPFWA